MPLAPSIFGFGAALTDGKLPIGERALLTILLRFSDVGFEATHTPDFYRDVLFAPGPTWPVASVVGPAGFYEQNSYGHLQLPMQVSLGRLSISTILPLVRMNRRVWEPSN